MQFSKNIGNLQKKTLASAKCTPDSYRDVHSRTTPRFIIYYVTEGPHRVKTVAYIDSLAKYLEQAYKLHKETLGMKGIQGASQTWHYKQRVPAGLYPVEVIETGLLRDNEETFDSPIFGLTFRPNSLSRATQIAIENDFLYGANCSGKESIYPFGSNSTGVDYSVRWDLALKVTTFHELYHSFQFTYFDYPRYKTFWLEASAAGVEEIGAPDVDDYINYLPNAFRNPGTPMEGSDYGYSYATFYLFLHYKLGAKFDSYIWDSFLKYPKEKFAVHLTMLAESLGIDAEDLFHEYANSIFFSGSMASFEQANIWHLDQRKWPAWSISDEPHRILPATAIDFVSATAKSRQPNVDSAKISLLEYGSSYVWVLSRLLEKKFEPPVAPKKFAAFPNPWNPKKNPAANFGNLPSNAKGVEIRSANGALVERIERKTESEEEPLSWQPKRPPAPGIMYYRDFPHGKNKVLIVEW